jgi:hypothetical protein
MADKKADKKKAEPKKKAGGGIMGLVGKVMGVLSVLSAAVLLGAIYDVGHMGLRETVFPLAWAPLALFVLGAVAQIFLGGSNSAAAPPDTEALTAMINDLQSKTASRFSSIQNSLDTVMGQDYEALVEENKALKEQLDAIHQAERDKVDEEMEQLRLKNVELEEQIKKWAIETVGASVAPKAA